MFRKLLGIGLALGVVALPAAEAAVVPWVGSADYTQAPGAGGDEDVVGPFDSYDFANGVVLFEPNLVQNPGTFTVGDTFNGSFQSYVNLHQLSGIGVSAPGLDVNGAINGDQGYELTVAAMFQTLVTAFDGTTATFVVSGGSADLYFDASPDYSFTGDSGFADGASIISAAVAAGNGTFLAPFGVGFSDITLNIGALGYDANVYDPDTIVGGHSIFTLRINSSGTGPTAGVGSVLGNSVDVGDVLAEADGNLDLLAVPEPLSVGLVGSAVAALVAVRRRRV